MSLKIGIIVDGEHGPKWVEEILQSISISKNLDLALVLFLDRPNAPTKSIKKKIFSGQITAKIVALFWSKFEARFGAKQTIFGEVNLLSSIKQSIIYKTIPITTKYTDKVDNDTISFIKSKKIDVFLQFGSKILKGDILRTTKYGVWSYHHGDNLTNRGSPAGFWEVALGIKKTGSILQILTEDLDGGAVIYRSASRTGSTTQYNKNEYYSKTTYFMIRRLEQLYEYGEPWFRTLIESYYVPHFYAQPLYRTPNSLAIIKYILKTITTKIYTKIADMFWEDQWSIIYKETGGKHDTPDFRKFERLKGIENGFWADPFVYEGEDSQYVFFEEYQRDINRGRISVIEYKNGGFGKPSVALEEDYHLSYPFVFADKGNLYMIPESIQNNTIDLYKCIKVPNNWEKIKTLMHDVRACDTNVIFREGLWWMFTSLAGPNTASNHDELFLFYAENLLTDNWTAHPQNPIVSSVDCARNGGHFVEHKGSLFRYGQNSEIRYGGSLKVQKIEVMTTRKYLETNVSEMMPTWDKDLIGLHTLNRTDTLIVSDILYRKPKYK